MDIASHQMQLVCLQDLFLHAVWKEFYMTRPLTVLHQLRQPACWDAGLTCLACYLLSQHLTLRMGVSGWHAGGQPPGLQNGSIQAAPAAAAEAHLQSNAPAAKDPAQNPRPSSQPDVAATAQDSR
jgi:hypothetical protein